MSLTAQLTRTTLATLVVCLTSSFAAAQLNPLDEKKTGGSTIRGTVVYADTGRPLRFAGISLIGDVAEARYEGVSDKRGQFVLENIAAGRYILILHAPGVLQPENYDWRAGPVSPQLKLSERSDLYTEVSVNGTDSIDIKVKAIRGGAITGRVSTEDDQPLANAEIRLLHRKNNKWVPLSRTWSNDRGDRVGRVTDASGVYRLAGLRAGDYLVRVAEPSIAENPIAGAEEAYGNGSFMVAYHPSATGLKEAQSVAVVEGSDVTGVDIRMPERASHTLTGTITIGSNNEPVNWAEIVIERRDEVGFKLVGLRPATTRANEEGTWRLSGLPPGEYLVTIGGLIRSESSRGLVNVPRKRSVVRIRNEAVTVLNVKLSRGAEVEGKIVFNGEPLKETNLLSPQVLRVDDKRERSDKESNDLNAPESPWTPVHTNGDFTMSGVPSGNYWFVTTTQSTNYYVKSVTRKGIDLMQTPIKLVDSESFGDIVVTLAKDFALVEAQLKLPEGTSKKSPGEVLVILTPANDVTRRFSRGPRMLQPDAQGRINFSSTPGEYFITALTPAQVKKRGGAPLDDDYFQKETEKFLKIKLRGGERLKGLTLTVTDK